MKEREKVRKGKKRAKREEEKPRKNGLFLLFSLLRLFTFRPMVFFPFPLTTYVAKVYAVFLSIFCSRRAALSLLSFCFVLSSLSIFLLYVSLFSFSRLLLFSLLFISFFPFSPLFSLSFFLSFAFSINKTTCVCQQKAQSTSERELNNNNNNNKQLGQQKHEMQRKTSLSKLICSLIST